MNPLLAAACEFQEFAAAHGWRCCIVGGLAVHRWGNPRGTQDVDISLLTGLGSEETYIDALLNEFKSRVKDAREFAARARILLLVASNGIPMDVALAGLPYEEQMIDRATLYEYAPGATLMTASAEDLVITKAFADRPQDWVDLNDILIIRSALNWSLIETELKALCELKEDDASLRKLLEMRERVQGEG
jgi:hypothetical protein